MFIHTAETTRMTGSSVTEKSVLTASVSMIFENGSQSADSVMVKVGMLARCCILKAYKFWLRKKEQRKDWKRAVKATIKALSEGRRSSESQWPRGAFQDILLHKLLTSFSPITFVTKLLKLRNKFSDPQYMWAEGGKHWKIHFPSPAMKAIKRSLNSLAES